MSVKLRQKELKDGRKSLYLDIYHQAKRHCEFLELYLEKNKAHNKETLALAESIRAKKQLELQSEDYDYTPNHKKKADLLALVDKVIKDKEYTETVRGIHNYKATKKHLKGFMKGTSRVHTLNEKWFEEFKSYLATQVSTNTANHYISKTKVVLRYAYREGFISKPFYENVKQFKQTESKKVFLSSEEVSTLANTPTKHKHIKSAFLFGCYTGLRHSDISSLTWGQIEGKQINFRQKKTSEFQYQPLNNTALMILNSLKGKNTIPLPELKIFNIPDAQHINKHLKSWVSESGITKHVTFHSSRHTFATTLLTRGAELLTVSKLLGHKDIKTTLVYAQIISEVKEDAVNSLPEIMRIA